MTTTTTDNAGSAGQDGRTTRVIDMKIPLPWLLSIAATVVFTLVSMWFNMNQLIRDVADLQITVKAGNTQATTIAGEMAILRFRVENLEGDKRAAAARIEQQQPRR